MCTVKNKIASKRRSFTYVKNKIALKLIFYPAEKKNVAEIGALLAFTEKTRLSVLETRNSVLFQVRLISQRVLKPIFSIKTKFVRFFNSFNLEPTTDLQRIQFCAVNTGSINDSIIIGNHESYICTVRNTVVTLVKINVKILFLNYYLW